MPKHRGFLLKRFVFRALEVGPLEERLESVESVLALRANRANRANRAAIGRRHAQG